MSHIVHTEQDWAKKLGIRIAADPALSDDVLQAQRQAYWTAIRAFHDKGKPARSWPLRYLIRHTAYHTLDYAREMEDKDFTPARGADRVPSLHHSARRSTCTRCQSSMVSTTA